MTVCTVLCHEHGIVLHVHNAIIQNKMKMQYILFKLIHMYIIHNAIVFGSFVLISQCNIILIALNTIVVCNAIVLDSFECTFSL